MQSLNFSFLRSLPSLLRNPHHILPHYRTSSILTLPPLHTLNITHILFDLDNTLTYPHTYNIPHPQKSQLRKLKKIHTLYILSNSAGCNNETKRATQCEKQTGLEVIRYNAKKPNGQEEVLDYLKRQEGGSDLKTSQIAMIGDRNFTDIVFGNRAGMLTIKVAPILPNSREIVGLGIWRWIEEALEKWLINRGYSPPHHPAHERSTHED